MKKELIPEKLNQYLEANYLRDKKQILKSIDFEVDVTKPFKIYIGKKGEFTKKTAKKPVKIKTVVIARRAISAKGRGGGGGGGGVRILTSAKKTVYPKSLKPVGKETDNKKTEQDLKTYIKVVDESFMDTIFKIIDKRKLEDADVYKKANIDRKLFSKLRKGGNPSKRTAIALCIALKLSYDETINLLARAGYTLSKAVLFDMIIAFFIEKKEYRIDVINEELLKHDQKTLGQV